ncbi:carbohydrate ABC transporter permease [Massiliimalia massiliensis]|uniref:carbohydrate ABC transporter permease n=1 Tax=Massiliimalia massiliensis TaxID=1852384 RepID=UPI000984BD57|nr:sugar ABC transporter permease [Massiliimalia massiliensis]
MNKGKNLFAASFLAPGLIVFIGFIIIPIIMNFSYSLSEWDAIGSPEFIGLKNYIDIFTNDPGYWEAAKNNLIIVFFAFIVQNPVAFIIAWLVTRIRRFSKAYQSVFFLPVVISTVATATMFYIMLNSDVGVISKFLAMLGIEYAWLSDPKVVLVSVIAPQLWQYLGIHFIMFLGGIQAIENDVLESARIDGASTGCLLWRIIVPLSWPSIQMSLIYTFIGCLKTFDYSYIMTKGGPGNASSFIATILFKEGFMKNHYGYATAIAVTIFVYSLVFTLIFKTVTKKMDLN